MVKNSLIRWTLFFSFFYKENEGSFNDKYKVVSINDRFMHVHADDLHYTHDRDAYHR